MSANAVSRYGYSSHTHATPTNPPVATRSSQVLSRISRSCVPPSTTIGSPGAGGGFDVVYAPLLLDFPELGPVYEPAREANVRILLYGHS